MSPLTRLACALTCGLVSLLGLASCATQPMLTATLTPPPMPAPSLIFTAAQASKFQLEFWLSEKITGYWTPTAENVATLEGSLAAYLAQNQAAFTRPVAEALTYQRQYVGLQYGAKQVIYANFFCSEAGLNAQQELVLVLDGGDCFFQVQYEVTTGTFFELQVNGEA